MSKSTDKLPALLELDAQVLDPVEFPAFLGSLKDNPERAGTAASLFVREVKKAGMVNVDDVEPYRRPYFEMLRKQGIPAYKAFEKVRGSHRFMLRLMRFFEGADQNGRELNQFLVIYGPPGSAKSLTVDSMIKVLEGKVVYSVQGCPERENPINLLKLLDPEKLVSVSDAIGMLERNPDGSVKHDKLADLMKTAQEPCSHCFRKVMGMDKSGASSPSTKPNLSAVTVEGVRLSSRSNGISVWSPSPAGQGCSLPTAMRQGNRGIIRMQEAFSAEAAPEGEVNELQILLEATEGRRLPASSVDCGSSAGFIPLDMLIVAETNEGAWTKFNKAQSDPLIYGRRSRVFSKPHNTVFCEEVKAYHDFLAQLKNKPKFDPLVLDVVASLSVASHMRDDKNFDGPDLDTRMRLYDGEVLAIDRTAVPKPGTPPIGLGSGMASMYSSSAAKPTAQKPKDGHNLTKLWEKAGDSEGMSGLEMGFMFSTLSQLARFGIDEGLEKPILKDGEVITSLFAMSYLKARVELALNTPALDQETIDMLKRCLDYLKRADSPTDTPGLIETRYRRWLHAQVFGVFAPDYAKRADEVFKRYRTLSGAVATGRDSFTDNSHGQNRSVRILPKDHEFMGRLEKAMGITNSEEVNNFRRSFESDLVARVAELATINGDQSVDFDNLLSWDSHPDMKKGITALLNQEIAEKIQRVLSEDVNLKSDDRKLKEASIARFEELGYSEGARKEVLEYFKKFELWKS